LGDEHVPARAEPRQQRLAGERGEHGSKSTINRVATLAQDVSASFGGERVARRDDSQLRLSGRHASDDDAAMRRLKVVSAEG
jgi:hypothetical protein